METLSIPIDIGPILTEDGPRVLFRTHMPKGWAALLLPRDADRLAVNLLVASADARGASVMAEVAERLELDGAQLEELLNDVLRAREVRDGRVDRITDLNGEATEVGRPGYDGHERAEEDMK